MLEQVATIVAIAASVCGIVSFVQANRLHYPLRAALVVAGWMLAMAIATGFAGFVVILIVGSLVEPYLNGSSWNDCALSGLLMPVECGAHKAYIDRLMPVALMLGGAAGIAWTSLAVFTDRAAVRKIWREQSRSRPAPADPESPPPQR